MKGKSYAVLLCSALIITSFCVSGDSQISTGSSSSTYVVQRGGDNLSRIARAYNTTPELLLSFNRLGSDRITIGQVLSIPLPLAALPQASSPEKKVKASNTHPMRYQLVEAGFQFLGVRYRLSGTSSKSGFDCSGLVKTLFSKFNIDVPRSSREQFRHGEKVERHALEAGDLVFFSSGGTQPTHVGIYVGDNKFLHAALKAKRVIVSDLNKLWYAVRYLGARRVTDLWSDEQPVQAVTSEQ